jgi:hypothetical protein
MRWAALLSLAFAIVALVILVRGESEERAYNFIATALGVGLSVLLGIAFMTLLLLSRRHARDDSATQAIKKESNDDRS